jgi:hypothetical protein
MLVLKLMFAATLLNGAIFLVVAAAMDPGEIRAIKMPERKLL